MKLLDEFKFGKHKGKSLQEVIDTDKQYLIWFIEQPCKNPQYALADRATKDSIRKLLGSEAPKKAKEEPGQIMISYTLGEIEKKLDYLIDLIKVSVIGTEPQEDTTKWPEEE